MCFNGVKFELAPPQFWPQLCRDLLNCGESQLACRQHDVGHVRDYQFDLDVPTDVRIMNPYAGFNAEQRVWVA